MEADLQSPVKVDGDRTRDAILRAAQRLFVAHGFAATSMATVAKEAGVTKSLIHHHFGSKRELWEAVKAAVMEEYGRQQERLLVARPPDLSLVVDSFVVYFRFLQKNPEVVRLWNWMAIENDEQCAELSRALIQSGLAILRRGQAEGHLRNDIDAEYVLAQFFTLARGWFVERPVLRDVVLTGLDEATCDDRYLQSTLELLRTGLAPR